MSVSEEIRCRRCGNPTITAWRTYALRETARICVPCTCGEGDVSTRAIVTEVEVEEYLEFEDGAVVTRDPHRTAALASDEREVGCARCFAESAVDPVEGLEPIEVEGPFNERWTFTCAACAPLGATA